MHPLKIGLKRFVVVYYLGLQIVIVSLAGIIRGGSFVPGVDAVLALSVAIGYQLFLCWALGFYAQREIGRKKAVVFAMMIVPALLLVSAFKHL